MSEQRLKTPSFFARRPNEIGGAGRRSVVTLWNTGDRLASFRSRSGACKSIWPTHGEARQSSKPRCHIQATSLVERTGAAGPGSLNIDLAAPVAKTPSHGSTQSISTGSRGPRTCDEYIPWQREKRGISNSAVPAARKRGGWPPGKPPLSHTQRPGTKKTRDSMELRIGEPRSRN